MRQRSNARTFLLEDNLTGYAPDQIFRKRRLLDDVLRGVGLPRDGQADVAADLAVRVARRAGDATLGVALETVLTTAAVS